jgi:hypothetical protein
MLIPNLASEEWMKVFGCATHRCPSVPLTYRWQILEANGKSYRLRKARKPSFRKPPPRQDLTRDKSRQGSRSLLCLLTSPPAFHTLLEKCKKKARYAEEKK